MMVADSARAMRRSRSRDRNASRGRRRRTWMTVLDVRDGQPLTEVTNSTPTERLTGLDWPRSVEIKVVLTAVEMMSNVDL